MPGLIPCYVSPCLPRGVNGVSGSHSKRSAFTEPVWLEVDNCCQYFPLALRFGIFKKMGCTIMAFFHLYKKEKFSNCERRNIIYFLIFQCIAPPLADIIYFEKQSLNLHVCTFQSLNVHQ